MSGHSVRRWLCDQALLTPGREPYPIKLTPGQHRSLERETGYAGVVQTSLGQHKVERVEYFGRAIGDNVILAPRLDLFSDAALGMVSSANEVTSTPDNIALVEVIHGGRSDKLAKGDLVFIDMFRTKQGHLLRNDMLYVASGADFIARYNEEQARIYAIDDHVLTKPAPERMALAMTGSEHIEVPRMILSEGFCSGKRSDGRPSAHTVYQEVYSVGPSKHPFVEAGELVSFCTHLGTRLRIRGEWHYSVAAKHLGIAIDDKGLRDSLPERPRILAL